MVNGIVYRSPMVFTGAGVDTLPFINTALYPLPAPGADTRLSADRGLTIEAGLVTGWEATEGTEPVTLTVPAYGNTAPTAGTVDGRQVVSFDGISTMLSADFTEEQPYTIALVAKLRDWTAEKYLHVIVGGTPPGLSRVGTGGEISVNSSGYLAYSGTLQSMGGPSYGGIDPNGWHTIVVSFDGDASRTQVDDHAMARTPGSSPRAGLTLGGASSGLHAPVDIAEVVTWPRALTETQVSQVVDSMRSVHGL